MESDFPISEPQSVGDIDLLGNAPEHGEGFFQAAWRVRSSRRCPAAAE